MPSPAGTPSQRYAVPAISAHRGGHENAQAGTYQAYRTALAAGADYLEFDVRRTADGTLVACHPDRFGYRSQVAGLSYLELCDLAGFAVPATGELLRLIAAGRAAAHVDLKAPDCAAAIVTQALGLLDPASMIITSRDVAAVRGIRRRYPKVQAGLTIGGDLAEAARYALRRARGLAGTRLETVAAAGAQWAAVHYRLADAGLLAECRQRGLRTMLWTVDADDDLRRWLASGLVDVLVTDRPGRAVSLRTAGQSPS